MLYPVNDQILTVIQRETIRRYLHEAKVDHLLDEIIPRQPSWLLQQMRKALRNLGHILVTLGRRLDRIEAHPA